VHGSGPQVVGLLRVDVHELVRFRLLHHPPRELSRALIADSDGFVQWSPPFLVSDVRVEPAQTGLPVLNQLLREDLVLLRQSGHVFDEQMENGIAVLVLSVLLAVDKSKQQVDCFLAVYSVQLSLLVGDHVVDRQQLLVLVAEQLQVRGA
jgi:hypothetical protein